MRSPYYTEPEESAREAAYGPARENAGFAVREPFDPKDLEDLNAVEPLPEDVRASILYALALALILVGYVAGCVVLIVTSLFTKGA